MYLDPREYEKAKRNLSGHTKEIRDLLKKDPNEGIPIEKLYARSESDPIKIDIKPINRRVKR